MVNFARCVFLDIKFSNAGSETGKAAAVHGHPKSRERAFVDQRKERTKERKNKKKVAKKIKER